jgi:hypothetical protein
MLDLELAVDRGADCNALGPAVRSIVDAGLRRISSLRDELLSESLTLY